MSDSGSGAGTGAGAAEMKPKDRIWSSRTKLRRIKFAVNRRSRPQRRLSAWRTENNYIKLCKKRKEKGELLYMNLTFACAVPLC